MSTSSVLVSPSRGARAATWPVVAVICAAVVVVGLFVQPQVAWSGILIAGFYGLTLALGVSIFAAINAVAGAKWCRPINLVFPVCGRTLLPALLAIGLVLLLGLGEIYHWSMPGVMENDHLLHQKHAWLNVPFFLARAAIVMLIFYGLTTLLFGGRGGQPSARVGAMFIVAFALSISVASWDWIMSLEAEWFSTMFGVYAFLGAFVAGIAVVIVISSLLHEAGDRRIRFGDKQVKDLGSLLFAFSLFWAYIWFCQFMLIWYANIPEEAGYFVRRLSNGWAMLFWLNPLVTWVVPFVVLMSTRAKQNRTVLFQVAGVVLAGRWLDVFLMVSPAFGHGPEIPIYAAAATILVCGAMLLVLRRNLARA